MGCSHRLRSNNSGVRKLVAEHHGGVAEVQLDLHEFVPRNGNATVLRGAEHLHIPAGGARGVANDDMRTEMDDHESSVSLTRRDVLNVIARRPRTPLRMRL